MYDVVIVGAGIAGLTSALTLLDEAQRVGAPTPRILILEGDSRPGGRVKTIRLNGAAVDTGAHWFHGGYSSSSYQWFAARYGKPDDINMDELEEAVLTFDGRRYGPDERRRLDAALRQCFESCRRTHPDTAPSLMDLFVWSGVQDEVESYGTYLAQCWAGVDSAGQVSAGTYYDSREATPGGIQLRDGLEAVVTNMTGELVRRGVSIQCRTRVTSVRQHGTGVTLADASNIPYQASHALVTVSVAVLQSQAIAFAPPLAPRVDAYIHAVQPARITKIVVPVHENFFRMKGIPEESRYGAVDEDGGHFCFANGAGEPLVVLFVGGRLADRVEHMTPDEEQAFTFGKLDRIGALDGYRAAVSGHHFVSRWNSHPLFRCAYSAMKVGHGPRQEALTDGHVTFAGEAFASRDAATLTGAWRSGRQAGMDIHARLMSAL